MHHLQKLLMIVLLALLISWVPAAAQGMHHGGHVHPDSLILVTVSGTAIVDTNLMYPKYFLDEDGDLSPDYYLNFGPHWYQPDSGNATRPNDGDFITIYGGMHDSLLYQDTLSVLIVYEINGEFWRDPYNPFWSNMGNHVGHQHMGGHHHAFGWHHDTLEVVNLNGIALVDTTFIHARYFLDTDMDTIPDYLLNFGPPWYEPTSGAVRPENGDTIDIVGGKLDITPLPMVIVYEINGLTWIDSTFFGPHFGGRWIYRFMNQSQYIHTPWDTLSGMHFNPGWHHGGGMMMPDSIFCQMLQLFPQNMPNTGSQNVFAGFETGMFRPNGQNMMMGGGMMGGHMTFNNQVQYRLHFNDIQLQGNNIDPNSIEVKGYNTSNNTYDPISNATVNLNDNTVTFSSSNLYSFYILTGDESTVAVGNEKIFVTEGFLLEQNYPNPFNPATQIDFTIVNSASVILTIYNVLGQKVIELVNNNLDAGQYTVSFNGKNLTSGIYFYELKVDGISQVRKMNLMK